MIDWGDDHGEHPAKLWGFVDLSDLDPSSTIEFGGVLHLEPGFYAITEHAEVQKALTANQRQNKRGSKAQLSASYGREGNELFDPVVKEVGKIVDRKVVEAIFYLVDVEWITGPAVVVPDIGAEPHMYWMLKRRSEWRKIFQAWLYRKYESLDIFGQEEESEDEDADEEEDGGSDSDGSTD
jgi:hypothetical protein